MTAALRLVDDRSPNRQFTADLDWSSALSGWEAWSYAAGNAPLTLSVRHSHLRQFRRHVGDKPPAEVTAADCVSFVGRPGVAASTRKQLRATLRSFYTYMREAGLVDVDPTAKLRPVRVPRNLPRPTPDAVFSSALSEATDRDRLVLLLGAYAGLRRAEIAGLRWDDVILQDESDTDADASPEADNVTDQVADQREQPQDESDTGPDGTADVTEEQPEAIDLPERDDDESDTGPDGTAEPTAKPEPVMLTLRTHTGHLRITGKGGRERVVPLHPDLAEELTQERARRDAGRFGSGYRYRTGLRGPYVFPDRSGGHITPDRISEIATQLLGGRHQSTHSLRHRFAMRGYQGTHDLLAVSAALGHSSVSVTQVYAAADPSGLRAVVEAAK